MQAPQAAYEVQPEDQVAREAPGAEETVSQSAQRALGENNFSEREIELLICGASTCLSDRAKERIQGILSEDVNWNQLIELAAKHAVVPLLFRNLNLYPDLVPVAVLERFRTLVLQNTIHSLYMAAELSRLIESMKRNGIASLPFKGPLLASQVYGDLSLRQFSDLDILIPKKDVHKTKELFIGNGFVPLVERTPDEDAVYLQAKRPYNYKFVSANGRVRVELHWEFTSRYNSFSIDYERLIERLDTVEFAGQQVPNLRPEDLLAILCQHGSKHFWTRLLWLVDVAEVVRANPALDWTETIARAESMGGRRMLFLGLHLAERLFEIKLPSEIGMRIRKDRNVEKLAARIIEQLLSGNAKLVEGFEVHTFSCNMRERVRDRLRYSGYRIFAYLHKALAPAGGDREHQH